MEHCKGCDESCPNTHSATAIYYENLGCLPGPYDIKQMLLEKKVWMCHSDQTKPCTATGLKEVPIGYQKVILKDY